MRHLRAVLITGAAALALTACSSSGDGSGTSAPPPSTPAPPSTSADTSTSATPTQSPTPSATAPSATAAPSTSAVPSSTAAPAPPAFTTTCTKLTVMVIPGGAIRGAEIAAVQYVNEGMSACTITGVPSAVLLRNGATIGTPSAANGARIRPFTLQPGDVGESLLRDFSTCNAPLSDSIRVTTPVREGGPATTVVRPARLRACQIQLAPVGRPA